MFANPQSISEIFEKSAQYLIPVFQRHYVWDRESQWQSLWDDLIAQARVVLQGQAPKPHFCGAIVIDQKKQQAVTELTRFQVIDGQQRLTTFQVILAALRDLCLAKGLTKPLHRIIPFVVNKDLGDQNDPEADQYKLKPTRYDSEPFRDVITFGDRDKIRQKYIVTGRAKITPPRIVGAYLYFYDQLVRCTTNQEEIFGSETHEADEIVSALVDAFLSFFRSVVIMLDNSDDAQIIFETLNSRGTPLLASDLMRNYIFFRAEQNKENVDLLYDKYWAQFEQPFWTVEQKQGGRIPKPRLELLMTNVLSEKTASEVQLNKIYQEYLSWIHLNAHALTVEQELQDFEKLAAIYHVLVEPQKPALLDNFARFLRVFDVTTVFPIVMALWSEGPQEEGERSKILADIESFIVRRLVCGRETRAYSRFFLTVVKELRSKKFSATALREYLAQQTSETTDWPSDNEFQSKWLVEPAYGNIGSSRIAYILQRIERRQVNKMTEDITINSSLTVEHVMPRRWFTTWPLLDGTLVSEDLARESKTKLQLGLHLDNRSSEAARRQILVDTFGNLTLLTHSLNSGISNGPFTDKRSAIIEQSALSLNRFFLNVDHWDDNAIQQRGEILFKDASACWPRAV